MIIVRRRVFWRRITKPCWNRTPKRLIASYFPRLAKDHDEKVAPGEDVVCALESGERAQSFGDPVLGRAMIIPDEGYGFEVLSGEVAESFVGLNTPMNILLSMPVRNNSFIQWAEYATPEAEKNLKSEPYML